MQKNGAEAVRRDGQEPGLSSGLCPKSVTVLLVDDDPMVRGIVQKILALEGYHVLEAAGPDEALRYCERHQGPIHLLLTDVQMPGMNGCQLAGLVAASRAETKILLMTSNADNAVLRYGIETLGAACIRKPFLPNGLLDTVRAVLGIGAAPPA